MDAAVAGHPAQDVGGLNGRLALTRQEAERQRAEAAEVRAAAAEAELARLRARLGEPGSRSS